MSPDGTKVLGDLDRLPDCEPRGLQAWFDKGEMIIKAQTHRLGSGTPSKAPNLRELLRKEGITKPEDRSKMVDEYNNYKDEIDKATKGIHQKDDDIALRTDGVGEVVKNAYGAIDTSVKELNGKIQAAHKIEKEDVVDANGKQLTDRNGKVRKKLPRSMVDKLFNGLWETLDTTYKQVSGISDRVAAEAVRIRKEAPEVPPSGNNSNGGGTGGGDNGGGGVRQAGYQDSGGGDIGPGAPSGDLKSGEAHKTAMAMMQYLIEHHKFTPAQAAGIVANAWHESKFNLNAGGDLRGGKATAHGLFQWRFNRHTGFKNHAANSEYGEGDWRTHLDYMVKELRGGEYQAANNIVNSNPDNPRAVAAGFDKHYEKSAGLSTGSRMADADELLKSYNSKSATAAA
ncbi:phage tail tip lysozyme [Nocardia wallacei]|uniref:phage tail tip lysozyme n=1 Tax=Nocardia wallacei TaxID=480035 RepID=UPI002453F710|nr:phage tail tip lysozyme [Nocardia wallacei]